eukprot:gene11613-4855_t
MKTNKLNKIDHEFISDLNVTLKNLEENFDPKLPLVLTGSMFSFSVGFDMKLIFEMKKNELKEYLNLFHNALENLYTIPRPTIAAMTGHSVGAGLSIAQACDFRIISAEDLNVKTGFKQIQYGLPLSSVPFHIAQKEMTMSDSLYETVFSGKLYNPSETLNLMVATDYVDFDEEILQKAVETINFYNKKENQNYQSF